ncbi:beta-N-acetylhexosaminidase [Shewanella corallii]|uniref:Beta-hexosaminidase n=1 Tax=Shewanella corallii TaxID=560080 RepID=A0ABT0N869_9GAMM|nr:beta-N-acetylhexosaminidase [Shewanella corallii]MCL2914345.1 beta-N-acetylhexosaminidase [Shewanella corallii]
MSYLMMDVAGLSVGETEVPQLQHEAVGGVILFSRNFESRQQLCELVAQIRAANKELLIAVDHEGGRVQRFREGFTEIPAMGDILAAARGDMELACQWAGDLAFVMAVELLACDIDLSFAPVLDLNGISEVIGKRSFSSKPDEVTQLARAWIKGMRSAGMASVGKHFPGHGSVQADSHVAMSVDDRPLADIRAKDMPPFVTLCGEQMLDGMMPAHVVYSKVDPSPAGFSRFWLQEILRAELNFDGVIFSDDLGMHGASFAGGFRQRAKAALDAGCDMILLCNNPDGVSEVLEDFPWPEQASIRPANRLKANAMDAIKALDNEARWQRGRELTKLINDFSRQ